jgi:phosphopantothenoylcysteine decarboxylase/phosphopantothenate--cysteine ligase
MSRILLGVSGGIAAYKALELIRLATAAGHAVRVVQTPTSRRFVGEASFAALTGAPVLVSEFERDPARGAFPGDPLPTHEPIGHLQLAANADLYLIAPASANTIAKLAAGIADNLLTSCALAAACPVLVAPAMNDRMYAHPATQANLRTLAQRGVRIVAPGVGRLASKGEQGVGRLAEPAQLLAACEQALAESPADGAGSSHGDVGPTSGNGSWCGVKVLVTAGGTREPLDSVRFLGNRSSGRMGLALAHAAAARGADVTVIAANVSLAQPADVRWLAVGSAAELQRACEQEFPACDVLLMAAAVADFAPSAPVGGKIKKEGREHLELVLVPTPDVLAGLSAKRRADQTVVGFAAEHGNGAVDHGRDKLAAKGLDAVVVNDISRADIGFDADANEVTILAADSDGGALTSTHVPRAGKAQVADAVLDAVESLRRGR